MATIPVIVKHSGKKYNVDIDPTANGETFKYQLFSMTGVEPDRQKIIVKGGQLKDDAELGKLGFKPNQQLMMMGTPSGGASNFEKPKEATKFVEDMTEAEAAQQEGAIPAGLQNLGNTCYLNSTLQTLRAIPELQTQLQTYKANPTTGGGQNSLGDLSQFGLGGLGSSSDVTSSLRDLYKQMGETQEGFPPLMFLNAFRGAYPQFAERTRDGRGYAQQDAEEAWSQIISSLKPKLKGVDAPGSSQAGDSIQKGFVDNYMGGTFTNYEECTDSEAIAAGEKKRKLNDETFYKLNCHVSEREILHLRDGIAAALVDTYSKHSDIVNKDVQYKSTKTIARLPRYLPVHFVRFYWKRDVQKKAKILRKVTFPHELDMVEYCTDELRAKLIPVRDRIRELRKEELDVERARKRQRKMQQNSLDLESDDKMDVDTKPSTTNPNSTSAATSKTGKVATNGDAEPTEEEKFKTDAEFEAEQVERIAKAKKDLLAAVDSELAADEIANQTGLYELRGVITHQGASADSGHYTAYVKKEAKLKLNPTTGKQEIDTEDAEKWWWFNDDKVSEVNAEKIETLAGGGESHSALILLYRAVELPKLSEEESAK